MAGLIYYARHSRNQRIVGVAPQSTIVPALENDIKAWNDNPSLFTWTKTADEILSSLGIVRARCFETRTARSCPSRGRRLRDVLPPARHGG
jgi:hypothetical protein